MNLTAYGIEEYVSSCIQLATLLEVSAYPKPGNVHRTADFDDTRYEHFLASSVAIGPILRIASHRGTLASSGEISFCQIGIGRLINRAVSAMLSCQRGGNTILGTILLLIPVSAASGYVWSQPSPSVDRLRKAIAEVIHSTTPEDAIHVYDAIRTSGAGGLGSVEKFDVTKENSREEILRSGISLMEIFKMSSEYDSISSEYAHDFKVTFEIGYPYFAKEVSEGSDCNTATVHTFLRILSLVPDTLVARRAGKPMAKELSDSAEQILSIGGLRSAAGKKKLKNLDMRLRSGSFKLNPGTTADLTASSLAIAVLDGYLP